MGNTKVKASDKYRICNKCGKLLPNTHEFYGKVNGNGTTSICRECISEKAKERNKQLRERFTDSKIQYDNEKICNKCGRSLPNSYLYFPVDKTCKTGLRNVCRECSPKYSGFLNDDYQSSQSWTATEDEIMRKYYSDYSGQEMHDLYLPDRTVRAIECRAVSLGLQNTKSRDEIQRRNMIRNKKISDALKGREYTEETKQKMSNSKKEYYKVHDGWWLGKKRSPEQIEGIRQRAKGKWQGDKNPRHLNPLTGSKNGRWKGGINKIYPELRSETVQWQKESMFFCDYKCIITGADFHNIHHTTPFREIVDELFSNTGVCLFEQVCDYTAEQLMLLKNELYKLHDIYGYGACIHKTVHKLFHDLYGYINFTPYDFLDFVYRIDIGEFDDWFNENNLKIKINYEYVDYLEDIVYNLKNIHY